QRDARCRQGTEEVDPCGRGQAAAPFGNSRTLSRAAIGSLAAGEQTRRRVAASDGAKKNRPACAVFPLFVVFSRWEPGARSTDPPCPNPTREPCPTPPTTCP